MSALKLGATVPKRRLKRANCESGTAIQDWKPKVHSKEMAHTEQDVGQPCCLFEMCARFVEREDRDVGKMKKRKKRKAVVKV